VATGSTLGIPSASRSASHARFGRAKRKKNIHDRGGTFLGATQLPRMRRTNVDAYVAYCRPTQLIPGRPLRVLKGLISTPSRTDYFLAGTDCVQQRERDFGPCASPRRGRRGGFSQKLGTRNQHRNQGRRVNFAAEGSGALSADHLEYADEGRAWRDWMAENGRSRGIAGPASIIMLRETTGPPAGRTFMRASIDWPWPFRDPISNPGTAPK